MSVEFRKPKATIVSPLGNVSSDEVKLSAAINSHTTVTFSAYDGAEASSSSTKVFSGAAARLMAKAQTLGFSKRRDADSTVTLEDGAGRKMSLRGFLTSPSYMMNTNSVRAGFAIVAESALLANLKLDIYTTNTAREQVSGEPLSNGFSILEQVCQKPNIAERLIELTQKMVDYWLRDSDGNFESPSGSIKFQRHQINTEGPLGQWYSLLNNSVDSVKNDWMSVISEQKKGKSAINTKFNRDLLAVLRGVTRDFQEVLDTLASDFQLAMIPSGNGGPGKFVRMDYLVQGTPKKLVLPATSILLNGDVSQDLLPLQQVLVRGLPEEVALLNKVVRKKQLESGGYLIGGFPTEQPSASGDVLITNLPPFLSELVESFSPEKSAGDGPPDSKDIKAQFSRVKNLAVKYSNKLADKLITDYCRAIYIDQALGGCSTSVSLPADLSLWPGERYEVTNAAGETLFIGFLAGIQHVFQTTQGTGSAMTTCNFSHVMFPGFTLPSI